MMLITLCVEVWRSTDAAAQVAALKELGLEAKFKTNGTTEDVRGC